MPTVPHSLSAERVEPAPIATSSSSFEPTIVCIPLWRVVLVTIICYVVFVLMVSSLTDYRELVRTFGDNTPYVTIANAIEHWNFSQLHIKLFWGLPYAVAAISSITHVSNLNSLLAISLLSSLVAIVLIFRLWGGWVAIAFLILSREWLERSLLGGAEPLFLALLFAGFLAAREQRWGLSALLASLATVVRPMGMFGLAGIGFALVLRRKYRTFGLATGIGLAIGLLYILPLKLYFGDSMANVRGYDHADWNSSSPVTLPFFAIARDALTSGTTKLNLARTVLWIVFILVASVSMMKSKRIRAYAVTYPMEATFWGLYLIFLFTYNSPWARAEFPRFAIPLVPFSLFALERWIPKRFWILLTAGLLAAALSAAETVGIVKTVELMRQAL